jgi:alpha-L-fucosidase
LFLVRNEYRVTTKPGKLYFTFFAEARATSGTFTGAFELPAMKNAVKRVYRLADNAPVETKTENGRTIINVPRPIIDPTATVIVVEFEGTTVQRIAP